MQGRGMWNWNYGKSRRKFRGTFIEGIQTSTTTRLFLLAKRELLQGKWLWMALLFKCIIHELLVYACLTLKTVNGRPFSLMEDSGFRKIIDPLQQAIGNGFTINLANIREKVSNVNQSERGKLMDELTGGLLMLKIDTATCRDQSVLCINVQYASGEHIVLRELDTQTHTYPQLFGTYWPSTRSAWSRKYMLL